jgi:pimeloyl-ACP methyl ester carboxylesterase
MKQDLANQAAGQSRSGYTAPRLASAEDGAKGPTSSETPRRYDVGVPVGSPEVLVDGVRLAVARDGKGPPVICLHAIGHGGRDFDDFTKTMSDQFEIVRIDWPGQGRSGPDKKSNTPARYAELLRGIIVQLGLDDPIIVGCSIGGAAAIKYASDYSVRALVLANTGGLIEVTKGAQRACRFLARRFAAGTRRAWWYKAFFSIYYRTVLVTAAAVAQRRRIVASAYEIAPALEDAWRNFAIPEEADQRQRLIALDVPILFAWAMSDKANQYKAVAPTIARAKNGRLARFDGGHAAFLERPKEFVDEFRKFVAEKSLI